MDNARHVRMLRWMLMDALAHAQGIAMRCTEATDGTDAMLLFEDARKAIADLADNHPAMKALSTTAVSDYLSGTHAKKEPRA